MNHTHAASNSWGELCTDLRLEPRIHSNHCMCMIDCQIRRTGQITHRTTHAYCRLLILLDCRHQKQNVTQDACYHRNYVICYSSSRLSCCCCIPSCCWIEVLISPIVVMIPLPLLIKCIFGVTIFSSSILTVCNRFRPSGPATYLRKGKEKC